MDLIKNLVKPLVVGIVVGFALNMLAQHYGPITYIVGCGGYLAWAYSAQKKEEKQRQEALKELQDVLAESTKELNEIAVDTLRLAEKEKRAQRLKRARTG